MAYGMAYGENNKRNGVVAAAVTAPRHDISMLPRAHTCLLLPCCSARSAYISVTTLRALNHHGNKYQRRKISVCVRGGVTAAYGIMRARMDA